MALPITVYTLPELSPLDNHHIQVCLAKTQADLPVYLDALGLMGDRPTLVLVGGASGLDAEQQARLQVLFHQVLAPLAAELHLYVVDGGTDAGVMRLMGRARTAIQGTFPLIGVAPQSLVNLPDQPATNPDASTLELNHTHCLLVPGDRWGDESPWLADVATYLSGDRPSLTILINGGSVTWQDACASINAGREIVIMAGSGRTADIMAGGLEGEGVADPRMADLLASGLLSTLDLEGNPAALRRTLKAHLTTTESPTHEQTQGVLP